jgi:hypothetical protein
MDPPRLSTVASVPELGAEAMPPLWQYFSRLLIALLDPKPAAAGLGANAHAPLCRTCSRHENFGPQKRRSAKARPFLARPVSKPYRVHPLRLYGDLHGIGRRCKLLALPLSGDAGSADTTR